ncbi:STAS domain-containing protein [Streptomyces sp. NPDC059979]|uniref:STAS domain-containing protein n=1 Tax=Streptomyces sp. NPDC059979 TaxID=3347021 RepID=UPI0036A8EE19
MRFPFRSRSSRAARVRRGRRPAYGSWLASTLSGACVTRLPDRGDGTLVLVLTGEFDSGTVPPFRRALAGAQSPRTIRTIIDVSGVVYADSALIRLLVQAHRRLPRFTVAGPLPPQLRRLLELSGAAAILRVTPDVEPRAPGRRPRRRFPVHFPTLALSPSPARRHRPQRAALLVPGLPNVGRQAVLQ